MIRALILACLATPALADLDAAVDGHILPRMERLAATTAALADAPCDAMRDPFAEAALAWAAASHLTLGPAEEDGRARAILFWPDARDATARGLRLLRDQGPEGWTPEAVARASIAARGLGALERLIFEADAPPCALRQAIARDLAATAAAILDGWQRDFADTMRTAGTAGNTRFLALEEAEAALFTVLLTGLEHTAEQRLGRPMGTFDTPRPARAELRRAGLSAPIVIAALTSLRDLGRTLADAPRTDAALARAIAQAEALTDPTLSDVVDPAIRFRVETLQTTIRDAARHASDEIGTALGVQAGFNSADGD